MSNLEICNYLSAAGENLGKVFCCCASVVKRTKIVLIMETGTSWGFWKAGGESK